MFSSSVFAVEFPLKMDNKKCSTDKKSSPNSFWIDSAFLIISEKSRLGVLVPPSTFGRLLTFFWNVDFMTSGSTPHFLNIFLINAVSSSSNPRIK